MTLQEVIDFLAQDTEGKAWLDKKVKENETGLKNKNEELIEKNKFLRDEKNKLEAANEDLTKQLSKIDIDKLKKDGKLEEVEARIKKDYEDKLKAKEEESSKAQKRVNDLVIKNSLNEAISKANIPAKFINAVTALLKSSNNIEVKESEDGNLVAKIGTTSLSDFVKTWAEGDEGKEYVVLPPNSGGNASGSGSGKPALDVSKMSSIEKMNYGRNASKKT